MPHEQQRRAGAAERPARARRGARAGGRTDPGPPRADAHFRGPGDARRRPRGRRGRAPAPARARRQGDQRAVRRHPRRAARHRPQGRRGRGEEAPMTLWWIGDIVLLVAILPVVIYLLNGVLAAAKSIVPSVQGIARTAVAGSSDLDAAALLLTTQDQVRRTVAGVAEYGGSLDVILDDAQEA